MKKSKSDIDHIGRNAALLSAVEIGLGSFLHALHIPFSGHFLSLNEGFLLARATLESGNKGGCRTVALPISVITALLKTLSPAGKKLTPMLAISAQGFLFTLGPLLFGVNPVGICLGMCLLSLWAFLQPLLIYYLLFGKTLALALLHLYKSLQSMIPFDEHQLILALSIIIGLKIALALLIGLLACTLSEKNALTYFRRSLVFAEKKRARTLLHPPQGLQQSAKAAFADLFSPLFLFSLTLTTLFFFYVESRSSRLVWVLLRPLALGFILFFIIRMVSFEWIASRLERSRFSALGSSLRVAVDSLKGI